MTLAAVLAHVLCLLVEAGHHHDDAPTAAECLTCAAFAGTTPFDPPRDSEPDTAATVDDEASVAPRGIRRVRSANPAAAPRAPPLPSLFA